jgi:3-dehydroquinate synthase
MEKIDSLNHPVYFGPDTWSEFEHWLLSTLPSARIFILTDDHAGEFCFPLLLSRTPVLKNCHLYSVIPGEQSKNISTAEDCLKWLSDLNAEKTDLLVNLGGGVISDLGGFVAGIYKRGIPFVNIPTTLIGQADAAIGGKTGLNFRHVKNQVGLIRFPQAVFIDPVFLRTLPEREKRSGMAEILKTALVSGIPSWNEARTQDLFDADHLEKMIALTIRAKIAITDADPQDQNRRMVLNFGHSIGHALEGWSTAEGDHPLSHGEAVALGMIGEAFISHRTAGLSSSHLKEITEFIIRIFPGLKLPEVDPDGFMAFLAQDKKNRDGRFLFTLLEAPGSPLIRQPVGPENIADAMNYISRLCSE